MSMSAKANRVALSKFKLNNALEAVMLTKLKVSVVDVSVVAAPKIIASP